MLTHGKDIMILYSTAIEFSKIQDFQDLCHTIQEVNTYMDSDIKPCLV